MPGQLMFTSEPDRDILLCFAWWPWGNGSTISIRVAAYQKAMSDEDEALFKKNLKSGSESGKTAQSASPSAFYLQPSTWF